MSELIQETRKLKIDLQENEPRYISGELDLNTTLEKTDELYRKAISSTETTASKVLQDSGLLELQTKIVKQCAKSYAIDTLVFKPREFSIKVRSRYCPRTLNEENGVPVRGERVHKVWEKLGQISKDMLYTVPDFSFMYGTFDAIPIEVVKKKRKQAVKDKIGELTKPETVDSNSMLKRDPMLLGAERVFAIFLQLAKKSDSGAVCFYEFVTDPQSFTRTIENIFFVSLLVKMGLLCIFPDKLGLPSLRSVGKDEKENGESKANNQSVLSLSMEEWKDIVRTFNFTTAVIPAQKKGGKNC